MNMNYLNMTVAYAKLEGVTLEVDDNRCFNANDGYSEYNPITNLHLTMKAAMDYRVEIELSGNIKKGDGQIWIKNKFSVYFSCKSDIPRSIIECILRANGLYK